MEAGEQEGKGYWLESDRVEGGASTYQLSGPKVSGQQRSPLEGSPAPVNTDPEAATPHPHKEGHQLAWAHIPTCGEGIRPHKAPPKAYPGSSEDRATPPSSTSDYCPLTRAGKTRATTDLAVMLADINNQSCLCPARTRQPWCSDSELQASVTLGRETGRGSAQDAL